MELCKFLSDDLLKKQVQSSSVICLRGDVYPLLFCQQFIAYLSRMHGTEPIPCNMNNENYVETMASLQTTFLGNQSWYWLSSDEGLAKKRDEAWHDYFVQYAGPNKLFFFTTKSIKKVPLSWCVVDVPTAADRNLFACISDLVGVKKSAFATYLYTHHHTIPLDTAVLLVSYGSVLGKNWKEFASQWLHEFLVPETSLFSLSQAFFSKQPKTFFRLWKQIAHTYGPQFWIAFWSEQMWQAYAYVRLQKAGRGMEAKKISYRLPFSFKNRDWRKYSLPVLQDAHQFIYEIDFHMKNGGSDLSLELFYARFFQVI